MNQPPLTPSLTNRPSIWHIVGAGFLLRLLIDTSGQMFYPFVPSFAAGLGVSALIIGRLISLQSFVGIFAPIFGNLADRYGYRPFMRLGLLSVGLGMIVFAASATLITAVIGSLILGFGFSLFTPNLMAYLSAHLPAKQRSRGMGAVELAWGLSGIIGIAPLGLAIARWGWRVPLIGLGLVLLFASFVPLFFPKTAHVGHAHSSIKPKPQAPFGARAKQFFDLGHKRAAAWAAILGTTLTLFAASHLLSSYGQWLFVTYGLESAELGRIAGILGLGAFAAIGLISAAGDHFGSLTGARMGALASAFTYLLLPLLTHSINWLISGLFIVFFCYQFAMVNAIILTSTQIPAQRGKMMTLGAALGTIGISLANFTGPLAFANLGPWGLALPSGVIMFILWLILMRFGQAVPEAQ